MNTTTTDRDKVRAAVATRFEEIKNTPAFAARGDSPERYTPGWVYGRYRTTTDSVARRFCSHRSIFVADVEAGAHDEGIAETYHERASAEHWYLYEKDYS